MHITYRLKQLMLVVGDLATFAIGFWLSLLIRYVSAPDWSDIQMNLIYFGAMFFLWIVLNYINGLYDLAKLTNHRRFYRHLAETALAALLASIIFFYILPVKRVTPKTLLVLNVVFGYSLCAFWRWLYANFVGVKHLQTKVILVGYTPETKDIIDILAHAEGKGYKVIALIDPSKEVKPVDFPGIEVYHGLHTIRPAITTFKADIVVVAPHLQKDPAALRELYELLFWPVQISDLASFYELVTGRIPPSTFSEGWFLEHLRDIRHPIYDRARIAADYFAAFFMGILLAVLLPVVALAIKLSSPGPIFIKQKRIGESGREFTLYKFRSMYALSSDGSAEVGGVQFAQKDDKRVTSVGRWLRRLRLDELPQVWNLIRRDVTLIGPRPERPEIIAELERQMPYYPLRHLVKPGLTGWALIHQNYTDNYDTSLQKLQYDLYYIKNRSLILDVIILLRTINVIIRLMGQ